MKSAILKQFESTPYFTLEGYKQVSGEDNPEKIHTSLYRWAKAGKIIPIKKGIYMVQGYYQLHQNDANLLPALSALLEPISYLSLEYVLQKHNLITAVTYPLTCMTTKNTHRINNQLGSFWYRHIKPKLYFGFTIQNYLGLRFAQASKAKALFDFLYLRPLPESIRKSKINLAQELRLNLNVFSTADGREFYYCVKKSGSKKMEWILHNIKEAI